LIATQVTRGEGTKGGGFGGKTNHWTEPGRGISPQQGWTNISQKKTELVPQSNKGYPLKGGETAKSDSPDEGVES